MAHEPTREPIRPDFICAHCEQYFGYPIPRALLASDNAEIIVTCPFCEGQSHADLKPFADKSSEVFMGDDDQPKPQAIDRPYLFPERIPTTPVEKADDDSDH